jgi:hypothetical protein
MRHVATTGCTPCRRSKHRRPPLFSAS